MLGRRGGVWVVAAVVAVVWAGPAWSADPSPRQELAGIVADVKALSEAVTKLQASAKKALAAQEGESATVAVELTLARAIGGADLEVQLIRSGGDWREGWARCPKRSPVVCGVDASNLNWADGQLKGHLRVDLRWDRKLSGVDNSDTLIVQLAGQQLEGAVGGEFSLAGSRRAVIPPAEGRFAGKIVSRGPIAFAPYKDDPAAAMTNTTFQEAARMEAEADRLTRIARAIEACLAHRVPFAVALQAQPIVRIERLPHGKTGKKPKLLDDPFGGDADDPFGSAEPPMDPKTRAMLGEIATRVKQMRRHVESAVDGDTFARATTPVGSADPTDPRFGPWYGLTPLPGDPKTPNKLPAQAGPHEWFYVDGWRVLGPVPAEPWWTLTAPTLGEWTPARSAHLLLDRKQLGAAFQMDVTRLGWQEPSVEAHTGRVIPPIWTHSKHAKPKLHAGLEFGAFYASATLTSGADRDVWMAMAVNDRAKLWVNGRLAWASPANPPAGSEEQHHLFRVRLAKGPNRLLVRCGNERGRQFFSLRVAPSAQPRDASTVAKARAVASDAAHALADPRAGTVGWRGDGTGRYPDASPVRAWDLKEGTNVLWRVPLPWANCTPVVAGERVFTQVEPHWLVCLRASDGKELWRRSSDLLELIDADLAKRSAQLWQAAEAATMQLDALPGGKDQKIAALVEGGMGRDEAETRYNALRVDQMAWWRFFRQHTRIAQPSWGDYYGHSFPTPVTDGKHIWVKYGTGVAACYDMEGNRRWMVATNGASQDIDICPSPLLVDGKLIVEVPADAIVPGHRSRRGAKAAKFDARMLALDAATGKKLWLSEPYRHEAASATPVPLRLTVPDRGSVTVACTGGGAVIRLDDGKMLIACMGAESGNGTPVAHAHRVFYSAANLKSAVELFAVDRDTVGARPVWSTYIPGEFSAGQVYHEGVLYGLRGGQGAGPVVGIDAETGRLAHNVWPVMPTPGRAYMPPAIAGQTLFTADDARIFAWQRTMPGTMVAVDVSDTPRVIARSFMEGLHAAPVFAGGKVFLRTRQSLLCIGSTGEKGRSYEAAVCARTLLEQVFPDRPALGEAKKVSAVSGYQAQLPRPGDGEVITQWQMAGPLPLSAAEKVLDGIGGPGRVQPGQTKLPHAGQAVAFERVEARKLAQNDWFYRPAMDVLGPVDAKGQTVSYWAHTFSLAQPRKVRLELDFPGERAWLSGLPVAHGDRVDISAGTHVLLVEVRIGDIPLAEARKVHLPPRLTGKAIVAPQVPASPLTMTAILWDSADAKAERAAWDAFVARYEPILRAAAEQTLDPATADRAKAVLKQSP